MDKLNGCTAKITKKRMEKTIYNYTRIQRHSNAYCHIFDQMNKAIAYIILLLVVNALHAQNANPDRKRTRHWVFGDSNWIEWTDTGANQHGTSKAKKTEQMAVFSDTAGNLQLYFDSYYIYDSSHNIIGNGNFTNGFWTAHRGALFIPYPGHDSLCYLFYTSLQGTLNYALVNWRSKSVIQKHISLNNNLVVEGITATLHHNNYYYWISGAYRKTDWLYFFLVSDQGILPCPILQPNKNSYIGKSGQCGPMFSISGQLINNHNSDNNRIQVARFNTFNGSLSDIKLRSVVEIDQTIDAIISENDKYLYTQHGWDGSIRQYTISTWSSRLISKTQQQYGMGMYWLDNNRIASGYYGTAYNPLDTNSMVLISNTNDSFESKYFDPDWLKTNHYIKYNPPNFPSNFFRNYQSDFSYVTDCKSSKLQLHAITTGGEKAIQWQVITPTGKVSSYDGKNTSISIADSGIWNVKMIVTYNGNSDTVSKTIPVWTPFPVDVLGPDIPVCADIFSINLTVPKNAICPKWDNLSSAIQRNIDTFGKYYLLFYDSNYCQYTDTITVFRTDTIPKPTLVFSAKDSLIVSNYKPSQAWIFVFSNGIVNDTINWPSYKINDTGIWSVEVLSSTGCNKARHSIKISALKTSTFTKPQIQLYPNPANNKIKIIPAQLYNYSISNELGQIIMFGNEPEINVEELKSGLYVLQIKSPQNIQYHFKFIKL